MRFIQQANLIIMLAMYWALAAVILMDPFYGIVTALVLALFSLLISVVLRKFVAEQARKMTNDEVMQLNDIINQNGLMVFIWRVEPGKWPVAFVSENAENILGYSAKDFISGRVQWPAITHPDDAPRLEKEVAGYLEQGAKKWSREYRLITKSGENKWFSDDNLALEDSNGKIVRIQAIVRDVTERKKAEEALLFKTMLLEAQSETSIDGILAVDNEGHSILFNKRFGEIWKMPRQILDTKDDKIMLEYILKQLKDPASFSRKVTYLYAHKGEKSRDEIECTDGRCFDRYSSPLISADGKYHGRIWYFHDITKRKQAEAKAIMLSDAIETAHQGCLIISEDYKVNFSNNYALTKLGFDSDELKNLDLFSLCADREQIKDIIETMKVTKRWMGEIAVTKKNGGQFPALVNITTLGADDDPSGGRGNIILFQDIMVQKEMREKLLTSEKLAVMGRLVADVAHELNNPLAIVIGGTQLVLSRIDEKTQTTFKSQLETVLRNARRCKTILGNLLGYGRTIGKKEEAVNLPGLIREAIDDVNYQHDMSAIETVLNYPVFAKGSARAGSEQAVAKITGNRSALLSVFVNLIRNARQAMGEKGRLTVTIEKEDAKYLRIEIHDTGIGMNKEQKIKLFKPFTSGWKKGEGSGLGLATSLGIIETHGGSMSAESEGAGKGSTFTILLPEFKGKK